jgi:signal transduction histidine kinase
MRKMLRKLRIRLTVLYLLSAVALAIAVGGGSYSLVNYYFRETNDHALKVKMGLQFAALDIPLPKDLYEAVRQAGLVITKVPPQPTAQVHPGETEPTSTRTSEEHSEGLQESELANIYVIPLTLEGGLVSGLNAQPAAVFANPEAVQAAVKNGFDLRTIQASDGTPVRLLTYLVPDKHQVQVFQVGRYLSTQRQVLKQLLNSMVLFGGIFTILFGAASWIMAGRSLQPTQQAWDKQQNFIANASHELRTPLTLIHAGVEVGLRKAESASQRQVLSDVLSDANYMNKLIEELLLLSRLDAHTLQLELQPIHLKEFLPELLRQVERVANIAEINMDSDLQDVVILADSVRLKQVLLIVLDNAIRNNQPGGHILIRTIAENGLGLIKIKDSGVGIPAEHIERVFDRFYKVNNKSTTDYKGSGLGLSLAQGLVEAQNGSITLNSSQGRGTEVKLSFPSPDSEI